MVTPRKPDAKEGRPRIAWADDPDRYAVALLAALEAFEATNITQNSLLAAVLMLDKRVGYAVPDPSYPGMVGDAYEKTIGPGESTTTEEGRAAYLRQKYRAAEDDPEARKWLIAVSGIFMLLIGAKDRAQVADEALRRAAEIGEEEEAVLRALLEKLQPAVCPDISSAAFR